MNLRAQRKTKVSSFHEYISWKSGWNLPPPLPNSHLACQALEGLRFLLTLCPCKKGKQRLCLEILPVPVSMTQCCLGAVYTAAHRIPSHVEVEHQNVWPVLCFPCRKLLPQSPCSLQLDL